MEDKIYMLKTLILMEASTCLKVGYIIKYQIFITKAANKH